VPTIPTGYAHILIPFAHPDTARKAVITFGVDFDPSLLSPNDIANAVWAAFHPTVRDVVDSQVQLGPVIASAGFGGDPVTGEGDDDDAGAVGMASIPANGALLVRKRSILGGKKNRGRYYIPWCLEESDVGELGQLATITRSDHQAVQDSFLTALSTEGVPMVILHDGVGTPTPVSSLQVDSKIGTQRLRLAR